MPHWRVTLACMSLGPGENTASVPGARTGLLVVNLDGCEHATGLDAVVLLARQDVALEQPRAVGIGRHQHPGRSRSGHGPRAQIRDLPAAQSRFGRRPICRARAPDSRLQRRPNGHRHDALPAQSLDDTCRSPRPPQPERVRALPPACPIHGTKLKPRVLFCDATSSGRATWLVGQVTPGRVAER